MIMITAITYIFLSYVIFDQQLEITFKKSSGPPWKNPLPPFNSLPPKNSNSASARLLANTENFSGSPLQKGGGGAHCDLEEPSQTSKEELLSKIVNGL